MKTKYVYATGHRKVGDVIVCDAPDLTELAGEKPIEVTYPVSYIYNGGCCMGKEWFAGYEVPDPIVPDTHELVGIGVGLQLNAYPPRATKVLRPRD